MISLQMINRNTKNEEKMSLLILNVFRSAGWAHNWLDFWNVTWISQELRIYSLIWTLWSRKQPVPLSLQMTWQFMGIFSFIYFHKDVKFWGKSQIEVISSLQGMPVLSFPSGEPAFLEVTIHVQAHPAELCAGPLLVAKSLNHRIMESSRLEKTSRTIKPLTKTHPVPKPRPRLPHPLVFWALHEWWLHHGPGQPLPVLDQ